MTPLPESFVSRVLEELGPDEGAALCRALDTPSPTSVRLNPDKGAKAPSAERVPWSEWGYYLPERPLFTLDPAFHAGAYYVQEASSQFVGRLLRGEGLQGGRILDLCAAPGGKTTLYASVAGPDGCVVANEVDRRRVQVLADNVRKWGLGNVAVTTDTPDRFGALEGWFDVVAADAPCSGEGMFRKMPEAREAWSEGEVVSCAARQLDILKAAWPALKPGGLLIYSTCTFNHAEDESVAERFSEWAGEELEPVDAEPLPEEWGIVAGEAGAFSTFRFFPHRAKGEGFFAAVARKRAEGPSVRPSRPAKGRRSVLQAVEKREAVELVRWCAEPDRMHFYRAGELLYGCRRGRAAEIEFLSQRLNVIYAGVALGQLFKGVLKPDGALAFWTGLKDDVLPVAELDGEEALRYLRKADLPADRFAEGMNRVTWQGFSLGFAKRIGNRVNNLYPNSLRIQNK